MFVRMIYRRWKPLGLAVLVLIVAAFVGLSGLDTPKPKHRPLFPEGMYEEKIKFANPPNSRDSEQFDPPLPLFGGPAYCDDETIHSMGDIHAREGQPFVRDGWIYGMVNNVSPVQQPGSEEIVGCEATFVWMNPPQQTFSAGAAYGGG